MKIDEVEAFVAVVHHGSYRAASSVLTVAVEKSAIARRIRNLEESLGIRLFTQSPGRDSELTDEGRQFLPFAYRILNSITQAREISTREGRLRIAAARSLCAYLLPDALRVVRERHPDVIVELHAVPSTEVIDLVYARRADVGLRYVRGSKEVDR